MEMELHDLVLDTTYAVDRLKNPELMFRFRLRARMVASAAKKYLGGLGPFRILDLGAAEGSALLELRSLLPGGEYVGLEYSEMLAFFNRNLPRDTRVVKGDVMNFPAQIKDRPYHIVSAMALLGHLSCPLEALKEAEAVLCPGGLFVATCSNPLWENISARAGLLKEESHASRIRKQYLVDIVQQSGLEFLSYKRFMWAPVALLPYLKIPVAPVVSLVVDDLMRRVKIFDWLFVNQCIIARKPR